MSTDNPDAPLPEDTAAPTGLIPAPWQRPPSGTRMNKLEQRLRSQRVHKLGGPPGTLYTIGGAEYVTGPRGNLQRIGPVKRDGQKTTKRGGRGR